MGQRIHIKPAYNISLLGIFFAALSIFLLVLLIVTFLKQKKRQTTDSMNQKV
jgi:hypothetical protein